MKMYGQLDGSTSTSVTIDGRKFSVIERVKPFITKFKKGLLYFVELDGDTITYMRGYDEKTHEGVARIADYVASTVTDASIDIESKMAIKERAIIWEHHMTVALGIVQNFGTSYDDLNHYIQEVVMTTAILYKCTMNKLAGDNPLSVFYSAGEAEE